MIDNVKTDIQTLRPSLAWGPKLWASIAYWISQALSGPHFTIWYIFYYCEWRHASSWSTRSVMTIHQLLVPIELDVTLIVNVRGVWLLKFVALAWDNHTIPYLHRAAQRGRTVRSAPRVLKLIYDIFSPFNAAVKVIIWRLIASQALYAFLWSFILQYMKWGDSAVDWWINH